MDTFTIRHWSGPCGNVPFWTTHFPWADRSRIKIVSGERIRVTLYGHGADLAQDVTGSDLYEWISARGTTTDYPNAPIMFGSAVAKGYVTIDVRAAPAHGLGNRTIRVKWLTGTEELRFQIVASCADVAGGYRQALPSDGGSGTPAGSFTPPVGGGGIQLPRPNLLPAVLPNYVLTRPVTGQVVPTPSGGMTQVSSFFGSGLPDNVVSTVAVPDLTWGVSGVRPQLAATHFDAQLIDVSDPSNPRVLDTLDLPQGFPPNTPLVTKANYPGRLSSIRVINNPRFQVGPAIQEFVGCFTEPGSDQRLDPAALLLVVDANNRVDEGSRESDNELRF